MRSTTRLEIWQATRAAVRTMIHQTRLPRIAALILLIPIWVVLSRYEPFRSHMWMAFLGSVVSGIIAGIFIYWYWSSRKKRGSPAA